LVALSVALAAGWALLRRGKGVSSSSSSASVSTASAPSARSPRDYQTEQPIFRHKFENGWEYWGFGAHEFPADAPARVSFESYGGIIAHHAELKQAFGAVGFRVRAPQSFGNFLKVSLRSSDPQRPQLPEVSVSDEHAQ